MDKRLKVGGFAAAAALLVLLAVMLATRNSDSTSGAVGAGGSSVTTVAGAPRTQTSGLGSSTTLPGDSTIAGDPNAPTTAPAPAVPAPSVGADPNASTPTTPRVPTTLKPIPLEATVTNNSGLSNGSKVNIRVVPQAGSQAFAFEAWLCKAGETFVNDADIRPTLMGKCLAEPLQPDTDNRIEVVGQAPYASLDGVFRVGVGTRTFRTQAGKDVTITCGPGNPCQIVLKLQYPDGFGFRAYPLTFG